MLRIVATVVSAVVVVAAAAALALFLWLRTYAPLSGTATGSFAPGAGLGAAIEPAFGSGGKTVYVPAYKQGRPFDTTFTLTNEGRFAVTIKGLTAGGSGPLAAAQLLDPGHKRPVRDLRIEPHETALVVVRWQLDCTRSTAQVAADTVRLRYGYLSLFTRTERVELPFAVTLRCRGGPPPTP